MLLCAGSWAIHLFIFIDFLLKLSLALALPVAIFIVNHLNKMNEVKQNLLQSRMRQVRNFLKKNNL